jgi:hypothetical protein
MRPFHRSRCLSKFEAGPVQGMSSGLVTITPYTRQISHKSQHDAAKRYKRSIVEDGLEDVIPANYGCRAWAVSDVDVEASCIKGLDERF